VLKFPSTISGKIKNIAIKVGDKVSKGDLLLNFTSSDQNLDITNSKRYREHY
jgi:pyruvate dehydrogenase E1 component